MREESWLKRKPPGGSINFERLKQIWLTAPPSGTFNIYFKIGSLNNQPGM